MQWNKHLNLEARHSFLSPSNHSWKNYDDEKLISVFLGNQRKIEGTKIHEWAEKTILYIHRTKEILSSLKKPKRFFKIDIDMIRAYCEQDPVVCNSKAKETVCMYVKDAIDFDMVPEQILVYDNNFCFGTADAIQFDGQLLRIHDLKTGDTPASMDQLVIYAALFCLEYQQNPNSLTFELRIYQTDQIIIYNPTADEVIEMMNKIVHFVDVLRRYMFERGEA